MRGCARHFLVRAVAAASCLAWVGCEIRPNPDLLKSMESEPAGDGGPGLTINVPEVVAEVNGVPITRLAYQSALQRTLFVLQSRGQPIDMPQSELFQRVLDQMVFQELVHQEAKSRPSEGVEEIVEERIAAARAQAGSDEQFEKLLAEREITLESLRDAVRRQVVVERLVQDELVTKIQITDEEIQSTYDQNRDQFVVPERVRASHVLISVQEGATDAQRQEAFAQAQALRQQVLGGADFAELARANSGDKTTAERGGDLGYFTRGQMVPTFEAAAFALQPGELSDVVETRFGYHVIKCVDRKAPELLEFNDQLKQAISTRLVQGRLQEMLPEYASQLRAKAQVATHLDLSELIALEEKARQSGAATGTAPQTPVPGGGEPAAPATGSGAAPAETLPPPPSTPAPETPAAPPGA